MTNTPLYAANNFIHWGSQNAVGMTPLKLQKLLYLLYARNYYLKSAPAFEGRFEKWPKGPVLHDLYEALKVFGGEPITEELQDVRGKIIKYDLSDKDFGPLFREVSCRYGALSAVELVRLTHDGPPGVNASTAWAKTPNYGDFMRVADIREDGRLFFG